MGINEHVYPVKMDMMEKNELGEGEGSQQGSLEVGMMDAPEDRLFPMTSHDDLKFFWEVI